MITIKVTLDDHTSIEKAKEIKRNIYKMYDSVNDVSLIEENQIQYTLSVPCINESDTDPKPVPYNVFEVLEDINMYPCEIVDTDSPTITFKEYGVHKIKVKKDEKYFDISIWLIKEGG